MEVYGLKWKKVYGCFELKYLTLLMMLIPCSWTQDSIPSFNVTCDSTGLYVKIAFSKPFTGIVYAKGYRFDPLCSVTESSAMNGSLIIPLSACGTYVQETDHPYITNTIIVQQHHLIRTANDFEKSLICSFQPSESIWNSRLSLDQIYESYSLPLTESSSDVFHEDNTKIFDNAHSRLTIFKLLNRTFYNDVGIRCCIAHNEGILDGNASFLQISSPEACFSGSSKNSSGLTIMETEKGFMAYVDIETLGMKTLDNVYLTCEVVLCKYKCRCSEIEQVEHTTSIISHKLMKRSTDASSEILSNQYEARTRFLKSTVKALMDRIMDQRKQNDKKLKIRKRLMRLDDSTLVSETNPLGPGLTPIEIFSPEPVATDIHNVESQEDYNSDDYDFDLEGSHHDYGSDIEDSRDDYDSDLEGSHHDHREEPSTTTEIPTIDSDVVVVASSKEFEDNGTKAVLEEESQEKCSAVLTADLVSSVNQVTENTKIPGSTNILPTAVDVDGHFGNCVPRLRFVVVVVVMGFFMGCLLLASCGMALYIRKEKKRNKINDFLLYSISY